MGHGFVFIKVAMAQEPADSTIHGYQYCSITSLDGEQSVIITNSFYVFCDKDYASPGRRMVRWKVDVAD
jgi:hypothetical protein